MDMQAIEFSIAKLEAKAGDTILFSSSRQMTGAQLLAFRDQVEPVMPAGVRAVLLSGGMTLEVVAADPPGVPESLRPRAPDTACIPTRKKIPPFKWNSNGRC